MKAKGTPGQLGRLQSLEKTTEGMSTVHFPHLLLEYGFLSICTLNLLTLTCDCKYVIQLLPLADRALTLHAGCRAVIIAPVLA